MIPTHQLRGLVDYLLIDGYYTAYRAYCALPDFRSPNGMPTGAIHGFINTVTRLERELQPKVVIIADESKTSIREGLLPEYKETRSLPEEFHKQVPFILEAARLHGWHVVSVPGYEADDVIATAAQQAKNQQKCAVIFTTDKDIYSAIGEQVFIYQRSKDQNKHGELLEVKDVIAKFGVPPNLIPHWLALVGDTSDNIPGVQGIGKTTAAKLLTQFGGVAELFQKPTEIPEKQRHLLENARD